MDLTEKQEGSGVHARDSFNVDECDITRLFRDTGLTLPYGRG